MERLLADAEKISGQKFNIDSYADVVKAINVIQTNMGITGTTAQEAAHTISGSINSMKAAWTNFLTGLMNGQADISGLFKQLAQSIVNVAQNVIPAIGNFGLSIVKLIGGDEAANAVQETLARWQQGFQEFAAKLAPIGNSFRDMATQLAPVVQAIGEKIVIVVEKIGSILSQVLPPILRVVVPIVQAIASVVVTAVSVILSVLEPLISWIADTIAPTVAAVFDFIAPIIQKLADLISQRMNTARTVVTNVVNAIKRVFNGLRSAVNVVSGVFNAIKNAIVNPIQTAKNVISGIVNTIRGLFSFSFTPPHIPLPHFAINPPGWKLSDLLKGSIPSLGIKWYAQGGFTNGATILNGAGERGTEFVWPSYSPYLQRYAQALAGAMGNNGSTIVVQEMNVQANNVDELIYSIEKRLGNLGRM